MSEVRKVLLQLDTDLQCSTFDSIVATDAGADTLLRHSGVNEDNVVGLVHGAMFTRSPRKLSSTAIFVGGSNVQAAEKLYHKVLETFFGPVRVSVMMDANGCNTTSAAAVFLGLQRFQAQPALASAEKKALVLGATGAVGQRVVELLYQQGWLVNCHSRTQKKAQDLIGNLKQRIPQANGQLQPATDQDADLLNLASSCPLVIAGGAAGVCFLDQQQAETFYQSPGVAVDLNAVPPAGIAGIRPNADQTLDRRQVLGALTVGNLKMQLHRRGLQSCFQSNDKALALSEIYQLTEAV